MNIFEQNQNDATNLANAIREYADKHVNTGLPKEAEVYKYMLNGIARIIDDLEVLKKVNNIE